MTESAAYVPSEVDKRAEALRLASASDLPGDMIERAEAIRDFLDGKTRLFKAIPDSLLASERECAEGRTAPRVSLLDIEANIAFTHSFTAGEASRALTGLEEGEAHPALELLTICLVVLRNGFTVIGKSAPASAENFDAELGRKLAREDAIRQVWPLMGYALRDRLAAGDER